MTLILDTTDWRILKELMNDGSLTNKDLAAKVGLTAPPCLRRVKALEDAGIITAFTALVDEKLLGFEVTAFIMIRLHNQSEPELRSFENLVLGWPLVREAHAISGETDYILRCVAPSLPTLNDFVIKVVSAAPNVASVKTSLTIRRSKLAPGVPVGI
jgi:DNA-binding Lrp family transcriptional regulator